MVVRTSWLPVAFFDISCRRRSAIAWSCSPRARVLPKYEDAGTQHPVAKKRTARKKVALATAHKRVPAVEPAAELAPPPQPVPEPEPEPTEQPEQPAPAEQPSEQPSEQPESSNDAEVWDELNQHIVDIERNLGELRETLRAHDLIEAIEPVLMEIKNDVEAGRAKSELTAVGLDQIRQDLSELHSQLIAVGGRKFWKGLFASGIPSLVYDLLQRMNIHVRRSTKKLLYRRTVVGQFFFVHLEDLLPLIIKAAILDLLNPCIQS